jgi:hypothetical protein
MAESNPDYSELVKRLLDPSVAELQVERRDAADAIEQQAREIDSLRRCAENRLDHMTILSQLLEAARAELDRRGNDWSVETLNRDRDAFQAELNRLRGIIDALKTVNPNTRGTDTPDQ